MGNNLYEQTFISEEEKTSKSIGDYVGGIFYKNKGKITAYATAALISGIGLAGSGYLNDARAEGICVNRENLEKALGKKYSEFPVSIGLSNSGDIIKIFSSEEDGTFTITKTSPYGLTCVIDTGEGWDNLPKISSYPES